MRSSMVSRRGDRISTAIILSYVVDWIIIIIEAVIGLIFGIHSPNKRPFSLADPDISFPFTVKETISSAVLIVCGLVAPAVIILVVAFLLVPGPTVPKSTPKLLVWRRKLWEWFAGWTGLALSCATAWIITNGMKNLFGHWRPDLLARCNPDIANIAKFAVGGIPNTAQGVSLVSWEICRNSDMSLLDDGFRSFPSGHASFSSAGLVYLSLWLATKLAIGIPYLAPRAYSIHETSYFSAFPSQLDTGDQISRLKNTGADTAYKGRNSTAEKSSYPSLSKQDDTIPARNQSAAPPLYLVTFVAVPFLTAIYIASTRYADFRHHGFDILFGFFIGTTAAIFSFRFYQLPMSRGAGWAWGPRNRDRAFWAGVGVGNYASNKVVPAINFTTDHDVEAAQAERLVGAGEAVESENPHTSQ